VIGWQPPPDKSAQRKIVDEACRMLTSRLEKLPP
jgi:hypothetical protein